MASTIMGYTIKEVPVETEETEFCLRCTKPINGRTMFDVNLYKQIHVEGHTCWSFQRGTYGHKDCVEKVIPEGSIQLIRKADWDKVPEDNKGVWTSPHEPEYVGRKVVQSGCVRPKMGSLLIEGFHFVVLDF